MSGDSDDLVLQTLIDAKNDAAPNLDPELLRQCYAILKKYQFSKDRELPTNALERLIDAKVVQLAAAGEVQK